MEGIHYQTKRLVMINKILLSFLILISSFSVQAEIIFSVAYENKVQFPYYMGETAKVLDVKPGAAVELVKLLESKVPGIKVDLKRYPWKRCLNELEQGNASGAFNASYKEKRLQFGAYPLKGGSVDTDRRLTTIAYHFYKKKGSDFSWDGKTASGDIKSIGAPRGYSIVSDLKKLGFRVTEANSTEANLKKLQAGRVSAVALQEVTGDYFLKENSQFNDLEKVQLPLKTKPYYLMISNQFKAKHPKIAEQIWDAVAELREEKLQTLTDKYFQ